MVVIWHLICLSLTDMNVAELWQKCEFTGLVSTWSHPKLAVAMTGMLLDGMMAAYQHTHTGRQVIQVFHMRGASVTQQVDGKMYRVTLSFTSSARNLQVTLNFMSYCSHLLSVSRFSILHSKLIVIQIYEFVIVAYLFFHVFILIFPICWIDICCVF